MDNLNDFNESQEQVVDAPETEQVEAVESVAEEVASTETDTKPVQQSPEENAKFAEVRRKAEREAQDKLIAEMGMEWNGVPITTYADYQQAMKESREAELLENLRNEEADPKDIYSELKKNDPDFQELQTIKQEHYISKQIEALNADLSETGIDVIVKTVDDLDKLPNAGKIAEFVKTGHTLADAYFLANKKEIIAKQAQKAQEETIKKVSLLDNAGPGALDGTGTEKTKSIFAMSNEDFAKMKEDVLMRRRN